MRSARDTEKWAAYLSGAVGHSSGHDIITIMYSLDDITSPEESSSGVISHHSPDYSISDRATSALPPLQTRQQKKVIPTSIDLTP